MYKFVHFSGGDYNNMLSNGKLALNLQKFKNFFAKLSA